MISATSKPPKTSCSPRDDEKARGSCLPRGDVAHQVLQHSGRPLLRLLQQLTGVENTFFTTIDRQQGTQEVVLSLNAGEVLVPEGACVAWKDSKCRSSFERGELPSGRVDEPFAGSIGTTAPGLRTFFALPVFVDGRMLGTVCGASRRSVAVEKSALEAARLIGEALALQLEAVSEAASMRARVEQAEAMLRKLFGEARKLGDAREAAWADSRSKDALTGLESRRSFLQAMLSATRGEREPGVALRVLILGDVVGLEPLQRMVGHAMTDKVLQAAAAAFRYVAGPGGTAARIGGDRFALFMDRCPPEAIPGLGPRIRQAFAHACRSSRVRVEMSLGMACGQACSAEQLLEGAYESLHHSKSQDGGPACSSIMPLSTSGAMPDTRGQAVRPLADRLTH